MEPARNECLAGDMRCDALHSSVKLPRRVSAHIFCSTELVLSQIMRISRKWSDEGLVEKEVVCLSFRLLLWDSPSQKLGSLDVCCYLVRVASSVCSLLLHWRLSPSGLSKVLLELLGDRGVNVPLRLTSGDPFMLREESHVSLCSRRWRTWGSWLKSLASSLMSSQYGVKLKLTF